MLLCNVLSLGGADTEHKLFSCVSGDMINGVVLVLQKNRLNFVKIVTGEDFFS
jgi:hypothetical protein